MFSFLFSFTLHISFLKLCMYVFVCIRKLFLDRLFFGLKYVFYMKYISYINVLHIFVIFIIFI